MDVINYKCKLLANLMKARYRIKPLLCGYSDTCSLYITLKQHIHQSVGLFYVLSHILVD